jgi:hypothetical protein
MVILTPIFLKTMAEYIRITATILVLPLITLVNPMALRPILPRILTIANRPMVYSPLKFRHQPLAINKKFPKSKFFGNY